MGARGRSPGTTARIWFARELVVGAATAVLFWRTAGFPFLNLDDGEIFVRNQALYSPGVVRWALTTRFIEHYQPVSWIVWAGVERTVGLTAATAHLLNVVLHAACAALVCALCAHVAAGVARSKSSGRPTTETRVDSYALPAVIAALVWAVHPLRVEAVVWASAMPYPLALLFALTAALAWIAGRPWTAAAACALSLFARPIAFLLPAVLCMARRPAGRRERLALASMAAVSLATIALESSARVAAGLDQFGVGPRLTLAAAAPWTYLMRTIWPVGLTPIDPLALAPQTRPLVIVCGAGAAALVTMAAWRSRRTFPLLAGSWGAYLLLLAPAMGIAPSGLQATADRYTYLPAVAIAVAMTALVAMLSAALERGRVRIFPVAGMAAVLGIPIVVLIAQTWRQSGYWSDSVVLWTRAVTLDARNDVALYNLASALAERGRRDEAISRYEAVLQLVQHHDAARRNRDLLVAQRLEEEANGLAANRNLDQAIERYAEAVRLDPRRTHSHAALGIALTERGRYEEARAHLQTALEQGAGDAAVPNALAFVLAQTGHRDEAIGVLRDALRHHPADVNIRRNLEGLVGK